MEIVYSIFIGIISSMIVGMIAGIGLQCRRDNTAAVTDSSPKKTRLELINNIIFKHNNIIYVHLTDKRPERVLFVYIAPKNCPLNQQLSSDLNIRIVLIEGDTNTSSPISNGIVVLIVLELVTY